MNDFPLLALTDEGDSREALSPDIEASAPETAVDSDGFVYDVETGEVLGRADVDERFEIRSDESAEWALELRSRLEGEIVAIDTRLRALGEMMRLLRAEKVRRLSWWDWRFSPSLIGYARSKLKGKSRTAVFAWGKVSFRATRGTTTIVNMERAVAWVRDWLPERVKVLESVAVKDVLTSFDLARETTGEEPIAGDWLVASGPGESVKISTGIDIQLNKAGDES